MVSGKKTHGSFGDLDRQKIRVEKKNDKKLWPRIITIIFSRKCFFRFFHRTLKIISGANKK